MRDRAQHPLIAPGVHDWTRFAPVSDGRFVLADRCTETGHPMTTFGHPKISQRLHNHDSCIDAGGRRRRLAETLDRLMCAFETLPK